MLLQLLYAGEEFVYEWILMASQSLDWWIVERDTGPYTWRVSFLSCLLFWAHISQLIL